jgi:3-oxoacyl-[acyl-carrier protein] reductase
MFLLFLQSVRSIIKKQSLYATSKAALDSLTKYMALELGRNNIRVNNVSPGLFPSDMSNVSIQNPKNPILLDTLNRSPLGRMGTREEIANVVLFLLSDYSSFITGETIYVSGGLR